MSGAGEQGMILFEISWNKRGSGRSERETWHSRHIYMRLGGIWTETVEFETNLCISLCGAVMRMKEGWKSCKIFGKDCSRGSFGRYEAGLDAEIDYITNHAFAYLASLNCISS